MLHTQICELLGIDYPIIQAGMGPFTSAELVAAVSNAGGLGSLGAGARSTQDFINQATKTRELTSRPFAINFTLSPSLPDPEAFRFTLELKPRLVSFALGNPAEYIKQLHEAGILAMQQVINVWQALQAAEAGADIIIAQGSEAGGFGGSISTLVLLPQVIEAVSPIPVVAAGGIADGKSMAAALVLGAQGANIGTRFLASTEAPISNQWKLAILEANSEDTFKVEFWNELFPPRDLAYQTVPRTLSSSFIETWQGNSEAIRQDRKRLQDEVILSIRDGKLGDLFPFTGQISGHIKEILPAGEIVRWMVQEADDAIQQLARLSREQTTLDLPGS
jgi:enoyl-[acyl-carrier protein] reductase II